MKNKKFKVGDRIRMLETCGNQKKGRIYTVIMEGTELYVKDNPKEHGSGSSCCCRETWELVEEVKNWKKEMKC